MADAFDAAGRRWAEGMRLAQPFINDRRRAASAVAKANRGRLGPCGIAGCTRSAFKGRLCRKHYALVPLELRMATMTQVFEATSKATSRAQARYLPAVREKLKASA